MALAGLPRGGGNGDDIRMGILNIMRANGIKEGHRPVRRGAICIILGEGAGLGERDSGSGTRGAGLGERDRGSLTILTSWLVLFPGIIRTNRSYTAPLYYSHPSGH